MAHAARSTAEGAPRMEKNYIHIYIYIFHYNIHIIYIIMYIYTHILYILYNIPIYTYFFGGNGSIGERSEFLDVAGLGVQSDDLCFVVSANMIAAYPMLFLPFQPTVPSSLG